MAGQQILTFITKISMSFICNNHNFSCMVAATCENEYPHFCRVLKFQFELQSQNYKMAQLELSVAKALSVFCCE